MNKVLLAAVFLALALVSPAPASAEVDVNVSIGLPPPVVFPAPPAVVVLPDTDFVYVDPEISAELYFWDGWWWRFWEGRWYRSHYYDRGWAFYRYVPRFYYDVDPGWRRYYRDHDWHGHRWNYERIPDRQLQQNWRTWRDTRHWERQGTWGVQDYRPRPLQERQGLRRERQEQYLQRPEVQRHQQEMRLRERQPQVQQRPGRMQTQPEERRRMVRPQGGPAGNGHPQGEERKQARPEKKRDEQDRGRDGDSRDVGRGGR